MMSASDRARAFLAVSHEYSLGDLPTEQPHPLTRNLSVLANDHLPTALKVLHAVDLLALDLFSEKTDLVIFLASRIRKTLEEGKRVFLCGCGATGRLSLVCETLWRIEHAQDALKEKVVSFMAGGDAALIRSIENFEDHPEYGERQLKELGFGQGDLFVGITEGGETPFVIGATLAAKEISANRPFFLYCNPDDVLRRVAERSARVIRDNAIEKINLSVGPMALMGSTRMQASTVLMAAAGAALRYCFEPERIPVFTNQLLKWWDKCGIAFLEPFITRESGCYKQGGKVLYQVCDNLAISVLTDTTERSPTFSMIPFENNLVPSDPRSLCYLYMPGAKDSATAWNSLLWRDPRPLHWPEIRGIASLERLLGFDFSARRTKTHENHVFSISHNPEIIQFDFEGLRHGLDVSGLPLLAVHLILKMVLNAHSTLVMGRLGRFEGNVMTFVRPTNNKLVDRAVRYIRLLGKRDGAEISYEDAVHACFALFSGLPADQSVVMAAKEMCLKKTGSV